MDGKYLSKHVNVILQNQFLVIAMNCGNPGDLNNGHSEPLDRSYACGALITYHCNDGYSLQGNSKLICLRSGAWDSPIPTCISKEKGTNMNVYYHIPVA